MMNKEKNWEMLEQIWETLKKEYPQYNEKKTQYAKTSFITFWFSGWRGFVYIGLTNGVGPFKIVMYNYGKQEEFIINDVNINDLMITIKTFMER